MNTDQQRKVGIVLTYCQILISLGISVFSTPYITRALGATEYGLYSLVLSFSAYINLFQVGIGSSYIHFYSVYKSENDEKKIENINAMYLLIFLILGSIAAIFSTVVVFNVRLFFPAGTEESLLRLARYSILLLSVTTVTSFPVSVFSSYIIAHERFVFYKLANILFSIVRIAAIIFVLSIGFGSLEIFICTLACTLALDAAYIFFCVKKLKFRSKLHRFDKAFFGAVFRFSIYIAINSIVDQLNWNTDRIIITKIHGTVMTAVYAIGSQLNSMYMEVSTSISDVFTPMIHRIAQQDRTGKSFTDLMTRVGRIQFLLLGLVLSGFIACGKPFLQIWLGSEYADAFYVSAILMIPVTIPLIQNVGIEMQRARNKHKFRSILYLFMALGNLGITIPLCYYYGIAGAAFGTGVMLLIANGFIMNYYYKKHLDIDIGFFWKNILRIAVVPVLMVAAGLLVTKFVALETLPELVLFILGFAVLYGVLAYLFVMNVYEKEMVNKLVKRLLRKGEKHCD